MCLRVCKYDHMFCVCVRVCVFVSVCVSMSICVCKYIRL